jgi:hypothetical protein
MRGISKIYLVRTVVYIAMGIAGQPRFSRGACRMQSLSVVRRKARPFRDRGTELDRIIEGCASNASFIAAPCQLRQFQSAEAKYSDRISEQGMKSQRFPKIVAARQRRNLWKSSRETAA